MLQILLFLEQFVHFNDFGFNYDCFSFGFGFGFDFVID